MINMVQPEDSPRPSIELQSTALENPLADAWTLQFHDNHDDLDLPARVLRPVLGSSLVSRLIANRWISWLLSREQGHDPSP